MKKIHLLVLLLFGIASLNSCKKDPTIPILTTNAQTNVTLNSATSGGVITKDGGEAVTARGVCWGVTSKPTFAGSHTSDGTGTGSFESNITGLTSNTLYYVRAYATNSVGTAYGNEISFTTNSISLGSLTTTAVTAITQTTATSGGNITDNGGGDISARGLCWSTTTNPTVSNSKTVDGTGTGVFVSNLTILLPGTIYYARAYATNATGTAYGNEIVFATNPVLAPTVTTAVVSSITLTSAVAGGNITADGGGVITAKGVCWATTANPTTADSKTTEASGVIGAFTSNLTGLLPNTTYHVRAYATNSAGTSYGSDVPFVTSAVVIATLTTTSISSITQTTAVSGGIITAAGGGVITAKGICWSTTANPTTGDSKTTDVSGGLGAFTSNLTGLSAGTTYHVRAYAVNSAGTAYGGDVSFITNPVLIPTLTTAVTSSITQISAVSGGSITADGGGVITAKGVCWATSADPTTSNSKTTDASGGTGVFAANLTGLLPGVTYHVRAYATNSAGTAYGSDVPFTTNPVLVATLTTAVVSSITTTTAVSGGNITADGGGVITAKGICWATSADPTTSNSKTTDASGGLGVFAGNLTGLTAGTTYHVRAYATNSAGTAYGSDVMFVTATIAIPAVTTTAATSITTTTAVSGGNVTDAGGGIISAKGVCWALTLNPTTADSKTTDASGGTGAFVSNITSLLPGTTYHIRAYATNSSGTAYGSDLIFVTTPAAAPSLTTTAISSIDLATAVSGGNIASAGAGTILAKGICWALTANPTTGSFKTTDVSGGTGVFTGNLIGLLNGTKYYVRAYATNSVGTSYGTEITFNTKVADVEGNKYNTVTFGTQVWMTENLRTAHYNNGTQIATNVTDIWADTSAAYQWVYNYNDANATLYGRLYNYSAVTDSRGVCPTGWHIPSDAEFTILNDYLVANGFGYGGSGILIAKSMATNSGWITSATPGDIGNNQATNNSSGFSMVPSGFRHGDGDFREMGQSGYLRSSTRKSPGPSTAWYYALQYNFGFMGKNDYGTFNGLSARCVK